MTDSTGAWNFRAIKPGLYTGRICHFHFKVNVNGVSLLTSQFMFSEDSASFSSANVAAPLVQAGTMSLVTLTSTSGRDTSGNSVLLGSKQIVVSYSGTVSGASTITTSPVSVTPANGSSATFTVAATGTGTLSYQWYKGKSLDGGGMAISGATSANYTTASVSTSSVGTYYVRVTNTLGSTNASVVSSAAALTIGTTTGSAPTITTQPASVTAAPGASATFSVVASNATSYRWYKRTVGGGTTISGATASSYAIGSTTTASTGTYYVVVTNAGGSTPSAVATLTVTEPYTNFLTTYGLTATTGAANADPDADGIPNALEYLLGGDPTVADESVLPKSGYQFVNGSTALVMTFNLAVPMGGTTWSVEYSSDMTTWTTAAAGSKGVTVTMGSTGTASTAGRTLYPVTVVIPTTATQTYARVRVVPAQ